MAKDPDNDSDEESDYSSDESEGNDSADEWDIAALLPTETIVGASESKVYADSRKKF